MITTIKNLLFANQKKTDFKPDDPGVPQQTKASQEVVVYMDQCRKVLDQSLDGKNLEVVLLEFGIRVQQVIYEHIQMFTINDNGSLTCCC